MYFLIGGHVSCENWTIFLCQEKLSEKLHTCIEDQRSTSAWKASKLQCIIAKIKGDSHLLLSKFKLLTLLIIRSDHLELTLYNSCLNKILLFIQTLLIRSEINLMSSLSSLNELEETNLNIKVETESSSSGFIKLLSHIKAYHCLRKSSLLGKSQ